VKRIHRLILAGACSLALGIGLAACGGSSNDSSTNSATPAATGSSASSGGSTATTGGTAAGNTSSSGGGPPHRHHDVLGALIREQLDDAGNERHVGAREDRKADRVGVLLDGGLGDLLGRLVQARVDHLHTGIAQSAGDDLRSAVVTVESGLGDHDPDFSGCFGRHYLVMRSFNGELTVVQPQVSTVSSAVFRYENDE
jgi:hypothetical protein